MRYRLTLPMRVTVLGILATIATLAGCSDNGTKPENSNPVSSNKIPGPGSTFTFESNHVDSNGVIVPGTMETRIWTATDVGLSYMGRTDVVKWVSNSQVAYFHYPANGDLGLAWSAETRFPYASFWATLPFGSKGTVTYPTIDTNGFSGSQPVRVKLSGTATYQGEEDIVLNGETIRSYKVLDRSHQEKIFEKSPGLTIVNDFENTLWYAPKLGYYVKQYSVMTQQSGSTGLRQRVVASLKSYSLK